MKTNALKVETSIFSFKLFKIATWKSFWKWTKASIRNINANNFYIHCSLIPQIFKSFCTFWNLFSMDYALFWYELLDLVIIAPLPHSPNISLKRNNMFKTTRQQLYQLPARFIYQVLLWNSGVKKIMDNFPENVLHRDTRSLCVNKTGECKSHLRVICFCEFNQEIRIVLELYVYAP